MKSSLATTKREVGDQRFLGRIFLLSIIVLSAAGCAVQEPLKFSGSTIRYVNDVPLRSDETVTAINVRWIPEAALLGDRETLLEHTGGFTFSFLSSVTEPMGKGMDARAAVFVPLIWVGSAVSGAVYGTIGHMFVSPGEGPGFPTGLKPGATFLEEISSHCHGQGGHRKDYGGQQLREVNLDLRLLNEGLSQENGRFNKFFFQIVVHARLSDQRQGVTLADMHIREISAPRKMNFWKLYSEEQWTALIADMENELAKRLKSELNQLIRTPVVGTCVQVATDY